MSETALVSHKDPPIAADGRNVSEQNSAPTSIHGYLEY